MNHRRYPRPQLATEITRNLRGDSFFGDDHNGIFLAAPRRTGKTTFLRHDLTPALEADGVVVVYVDLWADTSRDPAGLIEHAISEGMDEHRSQIKRFAESIGLQKMSLAGWIAFDVDASNDVGGKNLTIAEALRLLADACEAPVCLIVDEAQQALTSDEGEALMASLKSARDQLNDPDRTRLMLVMSGSDRDKLLRLTNSNAAPFYGSQIQTMPYLGNDFVEHCAALIEHHYAGYAPVDRKKLNEAFKAFGYRPQFFMQALGNALSPLTVRDGSLEEGVEQEAIEQMRADRASMTSVYLGLSDLQQAVLWRMLERQQHFKPYDREALSFYEKVLPSGTTITPNRVQTAIESMRKLSPSLVWKSARGEYAVEDVGMHAWYQDRVSRSAWPPTDDAEDN